MKMLTSLCGYCFPWGVEDSCIEDKITQQLWQEETEPCFEVASLHVLTSGISGR